MESHVNAGAIKNIRVNCDHAVIDGLTLDVNMLNVENQGKAANTSEASNSSKASGVTAPAAQLDASDHATDGKFHLLLAASGSVATIKIPSIIQGLSEYPNLSIRVILTESAAKFLQGQSEEQPDLQTIAKYSNVDAIYRDEDEWRVPWVRGAPILHIELRRWADLLVIAPLSANTLGKISNGLCDNLLTSVVRAWQVEATEDSSTGNATVQTSSPQQKRILVAPAMNTAMWRHPLTAAHLRAPQQNEYYHWFDILRPVEKTLACGDTGDGAMCDWREIVGTIVERIVLHKARAGS